MRRAKSPLERRRRGPRGRRPETAKRRTASAAPAHGTRSVVADERGAVAFEFLLVSPFLLFILFAIVQFGIALNNQLILTAAAEQGALTLAFGRGTTSPYTTAVTAIDNSMVNLNKSQVTQTVAIGGSTCSSDSACNALLTAGVAASIALSYPCQLTVMGVTFGGSNCALQASSAATVQ